MAPPGLIVDIREKRFQGAQPLFAGLNLTIAAGSVVAICGPSGIGKSSLLRLVAGIDADYSGSILVDGHSATAAPAPGFVFQDARLLPWLDIAANIGLAAPGLSAAALSALLDRVGLAGTGELYPHQLSGGMQRRAGLARAFAANPGLLLLDEPFASLDGMLVTEMRSLLADLVDGSDRTVLLVTHDPNDAAALADRVIVLAGRPATIARDVDFPVSRALRNQTVLGQYRNILS